MRAVIIHEPGAGSGVDLGRRLSEAGWEPVGPLDDPAGVDLAGIDAAIDLIVADRAAKHRALETLDARMPADAVILTCSHADSPTLLAAELRRPDRVAGFGLLPPWAGRATIECARALQTSGEAAERAESVWRSIGFEPVWVGDAAGLVTPRIVACLANEAAFALMEKIALPEDIDRAMELGTRYPRGPLAWAQLVGLGHVVAILDGLAREQGGDRYRVCPLLRHMAVAERTAAA